MNEPAPGEPGDKDSCVVLYWAEETMPPEDGRRAMAFTYGLGKLSSSDTGNSRLSLTAGGSFRPGGLFTVTAYVKQPGPGQHARLSLPRGLALAPAPNGEAPTEDVLVEKGTDYSQVSWRVRVDSAAGEGPYTLTVASGTALETFTVRIGKKSIFD
jgi:hypothetical protein